jgi:hypothetical protein
MCENATRWGDAHLVMDQRQCGTRAVPASFRRERIHSFTALNWPALCRCRFVETVDPGEIGFERFYRGAVALQDFRRL